MPGAVVELWGEIRSVIGDALARLGHPEPFSELGARLAAHDVVTIAPPLSQPVVDEWLAAAVDAAPEPWRRLAALIGAATDVPWIRAYEHLEPTPLLEAYRANYAYLLLAGPVFRGHVPPVLMPELLVAATLQAPGVLYPPHHHGPAEVYGIISGTLEWQVGEAWSMRRPGDVIVHRSNESHAMRTYDDPALCWVAWPNDPDAAIYMPSLDPPGQSMPPTTYDLVDTTPSGPRTAIAE